MKKIKRIAILMLIFAGILMISGNVKAATSINIKNGITDGTVFFTGVYLEFLATFDSEIKPDSSTIPELQIQIGNGDIHTITTGTINGTEITYKYLITDEDQGLVKLISYSGNVTRADGTVLNVSFSDLRKL